MTRSVSEELGEATNVLLGTPSMGGDTQETCIDLLSQGPPEEMSVLWVSFRKPPGDCLAEWQAHHDVDPGTYGVIVVGDTMGASGGDADINSAAVQSISSPSDLTGIGIKVGEFISGRDGPIAVCFDSLTALLQYVDLETAYEFLHALTGQLYSADAVSHFHIDPSAHDEQTVDTLLSLFDAIVEMDGDEPDTRTRYPLK